MDARRFVSLASLLGLLLVAACGGTTSVDDSGLSTVDAAGSVDGGATVDVGSANDVGVSLDTRAPDGCDGVPDGTACGSGLLCVDEVCGESECGDGYVDDDRDEQCDDGNDVMDDGCEPTTCTFS